MNAPGCPFHASHANTVDYFDHNSPEYGRHRYAWYQAIRADVGPVFWTPHHGGFWVVVGWPELTEAAKHWQIFSSRGSSAPAPPELADIEFKGLFAPPWPSSARLLEEDPPQWQQPRRTLTPMFAAAAAEKWRARFQQLTDACIDRCIESGRIDFAKDISSAVPTIFSLELVGVSPEDYEAIAECYNVSSHASSDDPKFAEAYIGINKLMERIGAAVAQEKTKPKGTRRPGVIGCLLDARDDGAEFSDEEILQLASLVISAGIDTTAALLGTAFVMLTQRPELRHQLMAHPEIIGDSFNEFLRFATPTAGLLRTATQDTVLGGQRIKRGERVMLCFAAANRDPREFPDPETVILNRKPNRHVGFGTGIHRCIGANFAQLEFEVILDTVLRRMPDFQVDVERAEIYENVGVVAGWKSVPATFTPGVRVGVDPGVPGWRF